MKIKKKDPAFVALGAMGGRATVKKHGKKYYKKLSKMGVDAMRAKMLSVSEK